MQEPETARDIQVVGVVDINIVGIVLFVLVPTTVIDMMYCHEQ